MLSIKNVSCGYGNYSVLKGLSLDAREGEILGLIGPNGCGKTTLLRAATGIMDIREGSISLKGTLLDTMSRKEIAEKISVVPQNHGQAEMRVEELVMMGRYPYFGRMQFLETSADRELADRYMDMTGVQSFRKKSVNSISGGELQLALITRALVQETDLILLDEPVAHLDVAHQITVLDLVKKLNIRHRRTVVIVFHDLNLASEYCDRMALMNDGKIDSIGVPEEVVTYSNIERVYSTVVVVDRSPVSGKPCVFPAPRTLHE